MTQNKEKAFLEWLDEQIARLQECEKNKDFETSYLDIMNRGGLHHLLIAKSKFLTLTPTP